MKRHDPQLFIPGPTEVFPELLQELAKPVLPHRGAAIAEVTRVVFANLKRLFRTEAECFVALAAATGLMEGGVRNLVGKKLLATVCGAFSERMHKVAKKNGVPVEALEVEWGRHVDPADVDAALATGDYDVVSVVHSETSTGVLNPIAEIGEVVRKYDDVLLVVDVVSSLAGTRFEFDEWGVDLAFAGTQKCLALPPGLCVFAVSERAMDRAATMQCGHYFDFHVFRKMAEKDQCPATTNTSLMVALRAQLRRMLDDEGLEKRWQRHEDMAALVRGRLGDRFEIFPELEYQTPTESVFTAPADFDVAGLVDAVLRKGKLFGNGYGALKDKTFRIGHMGDLQPEHMSDFLEIFESELAALA